MSLETLVQSVADWETKANTTIAAELNAVTIINRIGRNVRWATVHNAYGLPTLLTMRAAVRAVLASGQLTAQQFEAVEYFNTRMNADEGIDLSTDEAQATIESMRAITALAPHIDQIKELGVTRRSPCEAAGLPRATQTTVGVAKTKVLLRRAAAAKFNADIDAIDAWDGTGTPPSVGG